MGNVVVSLETQTDFQEINGVTACTETEEEKNKKERLQNGASHKSNSRGQY